MDRATSLGAESSAGMARLVEAVDRMATKVEPVKCMLTMDETLRRFGQIDCWADEYMCIAKDKN
jgi:hypothetical protein